MAFPLLPQCKRELLLQLSECGIPCVYASLIQLLHNLFVAAPCMVHATCTQIIKKAVSSFFLTALDTNLCRPRQRQVLEAALVFCS